MRSFLSIFIIGLFTNIAFSQCIITEIFATVIDCDDDDQFDVTLAFDYANTSDMFEVIGNGQNYGLFAYTDMPITIENLQGDCSTDYEFIVRDSANPGCSNFTGIGTVCCGADCHIEVFTFGPPLECQPDGGVDLSFNIETIISNRMDFTLFGADGFSQVYDYEDLPITIDNYPTGGGLVSNLIVCDNSPTGGCCDTLSFENPCICGMINPQTEILECNEADGTYYVSIDFDNVMTSDSFILGENTVPFGNFAYADLPITVGPFTFNDDEGLEFLVVDQQSSLCFAGIPVQIVDDCNFECDITSIFAEVYNCDEGVYSIDVEFTADNVTTGDLYQIYVNNELVETVAYGEAFYTLENVELNCESVAFIEVQGPEGCLATYTVDEITCCICPWSFFNASSFCDANEVFVTFDYNINLMEADDFFIDVNDSIFGPYNFLDKDTISLGFIDNGTYFISMFQEGDGCSTTAIFEVNCASDECNITEVIYEWYEECDGNLASMDLQVEGINLSDSFDVTINSNFIGSFSYAPTFVILEGIEILCGESYELRIADLGSAGCVSEVILEDLPCCDSLVCDIRDLEIATQCTLDSAWIYIDFIAENVSDSFDLRVGGVNIGMFAYVDLPFQFSMPIDQYGEFRIADLGIEGCVLESIIPLDCDCDIQDLSIEVINCEEGLFDAVFNFNIIGLDSTGTFTIRGNDTIYGEYSYTDLPITISNLVANSGIDYYFLIQDTMDEPFCATEIEYGEVNCSVGTENIGDSEWTAYMDGAILNVSHDIDNALISVYNITGQKIHSSVSRKGTTLSLANTANGIYIINLTSTDGINVSKKIVKL